VPAHRGSPIPRCSARPKKEVWRQLGIRTREGRRGKRRQGPTAISQSRCASRRDVPSSRIDRFGIRTLCYRIVGGALQVAERADALADPGHEIDAQAIFDYLYFHAIPSPRTIFKDVHRLPPGHYALFGKRSTRGGTVLVADLRGSAVPTSGRCARNSANYSRMPVARQLDGNKPACFLSGGTDSSTVCGNGPRGRRPAAGNLLDRFRRRGYDEMAYARIAARHFGTEHHDTTLRPTTWCGSIGLVARHYDQPFGNSSALPPTIARGWPRRRRDTHPGRRWRRRAVRRQLALCDCSGFLALTAIFPWRLRSGLVEPVLQRSARVPHPAATQGRKLCATGQDADADRLQNYNLLLRLGADEVLTPGFPSRVWILTRPCASSAK
jgi:asparagine synthase (glutamine-hydrolysing)